MGLYCEFDVIQDFGYIDATEQFGIEPDYSLGCEVFVENFLALSTGYVPVDTGYLRSTLDAGCDDTSCYAETICEYAQYVEYGTWCQTAQPYFEIAVEEALGIARGYWDEAQREAQEEEQMLLEEMMQAQEEMGFGMSGGGMGFGGFLGMILGSFLSALIITTAQVIMGEDFSKKGKHIAGGIYMPQTMIT